jgi:hypothetical protein
MNASQAPRGVEQGSGHDVIRANQLIEAGLWLRLGGDEEGARRLFLQALSHDSSNRRAQELLKKSTAAGPPTPTMNVPPALVVPPPGLEVSVVLLDEGPPASRPLPPPTLQPPAPPPRGVTVLLQGVEELLALGDGPSATELLRQAEEFAPEDPRLRAARERFAREQQAAIEAKLGDLKRVPVVRLSPRELMRLSLDARAGFVLSRIDGRLSCEALFSVSGMSRQDTMRILAQLLDQDVITLRQG